MLYCVSFEYKNLIFFLFIVTLTTTDSSTTSSFCSLSPKVDSLKSLNQVSASSRRKLIKANIKLNLSLEDDDVGQLEVECQSNLCSEKSLSIPKRTSHEEFGFPVNTKGDDQIEKDKHFDENHKACGQPDNIKDECSKDISNAKILRLKRCKSFLN